MTDPVVRVGTFPTMHLLGVAGDFVSGLEPGSNAHLVIPALWSQLEQVLGDESAALKWSVGVMVSVGPAMRYFAGVSEGAVKNPSAELLSVEVPSGAYAICEHVGSLAELPATTAWFYSELLPTSGLIPRDAPHLEVYDERFDPQSADSVVMICAPVQG